MLDYPHRLVEIPSRKAFRRLFNDMERAVQAHRPMYKMYLSTQVCLWCHIVQCKVPTTLQWPSNLYHPGEHPVYDLTMPVFYETTASLKRMTPGMDEQRAVLDVAANEAPMAFTVLKSMAFSDDLNWFVPSEDLVYSLLATDLVGLYPADVFLPLPVLFIELPPQLLWSQSRRGMHEVRALAVTEGLVVTDYGYYGSGAEVVLGRRLLVSLVREPLKTDTGIEDVSSMTFTIPLNDPDKALTELMQREDDFAASINRGIGVTDLMWGSIAGVDYEDRKEFRNAVVSFVLGILLYMTTTTATKKARHAGGLKKVGRKQNTASDAMRHKEWLIGTEVKVSSEVKDAVRKGARTAHVVKTLVRGYFRRQHHGPKNSLTKMVQIQPHVRNYGLPGPIQGHTYKE